MESPTSPSLQPSSSNLQRSWKTGMCKKRTTHSARKQGHSQGRGVECKYVGPGQSRCRGKGRMSLEPGERDRLEE